MVKIDHLIRSKRKTISLIVDQNGTLTVRAPQNLSQKYIDAFVTQKQSWILEKQKQIRKFNQQYALPTFLPGEQFDYLGEAYPLMKSSDNGKELNFDGTQFQLSSKCKEPRKAFENWYREAARNEITQRVSALASYNNYTYAKIRISSAHTRWGSCSSHGTLSFSWRLVMTPPEIIDYVVIHELVHLEHPNHSRAFWTRVAEILPEFKIRRKWLKDNSARFRWK